MDCPTCGSELQRGRLALRFHMFDQVAFYRKRLVRFLPADGSDEIALDRWEDSLALFCVTCGMLVLDLRAEGPDIRTVPDPDDQSEDAPCMSCQATIPAGSDTCPNCGWSYNASENDTT